MCVFVCVLSCICEFVFVMYCVVLHGLFACGASVVLCVLFVMVSVMLNGLLSIMSCFVVFACV